MIESSVPKPGPAIPVPGPSDWSAALLTSSSEALLGAVRNYIGPVKTPFDKRDLVGKLEAFLRRPETRNSIFSLLDQLDCKILSSSLLVGPVPEQSLKELFLGEIPLFELGVRISNLLDRLLLFRYQVGGRRYIAVNPLLEDELTEKMLKPTALFGNGATDPSILKGAIPAMADAKTAVALFCFLFHAPLSMRKTGVLNKRASERAAALLPELSSASGDRPGVLARALAAVGVLPSNEDEGRSPDREAFAELLSEWGEDLPYYLASRLAGEFEERQSSNASLGPRPEQDCIDGGGGGAARQCALVLAGALEVLPTGCLIARPALSRWLRIVAKRSRLAAVPSGAVAALEALGIVTQQGGSMILALPKSTSERSVPTERKRGALVVEGTHALHLMPEASLEERLFVGCVARPSSVGMVWSFELDRDSVRRAFASGLTAKEIQSRFVALSGTELPQSFVFSLSAWEEEYRSLRLYRGFVLVADERQRPIIERSAALGSLVAERLAPGVYFLSAASAEEAAALLSAAGLEAPPLIFSPGVCNPAGAFMAPDAGSENAPSLARERIEAIGSLVALPAGEESVPLKTDPEPRLAELRRYLTVSSRSEESRRELADRIERRLVLTERQIAESDPHPERLEASGLDYMGKVRVVERALRSPGDRLEVLYRLPGEEPVRALLRPVKLDKNDKGLVLEAEDLGTGGPARVPLGSVSTVRRLRASLFGEDQ